MISYSDIHISAVCLHIERKVIIEIRNQASVVSCVLDAFSYGVEGYAWSFYSVHIPILVSNAY